jgi:NADH dehydrogenase [ubiquinone] 1 alpha subcomplex assembly factor 1
MVKFLILLLMYSVTSPHIIFNFNKNANHDNWVIVNDGVMGGKSVGDFSLTPEGHGAFIGTISLQNNGGFSMVRHSFEATPVKGFTKIVLKVKGDQKQYQFRVKANAQDYYSYIMPFSTNGEWQEIHLPLKDMYPSFRGRTLDMPNFSKSNIEEIAILIGNKKQERFKLLIDKIELR